MYLSQKKKIYYNILNKTSKKPFLVFLHGLGANSTTWTGVINDLKKQYPILYLDLRGHGKSQILDSYKLEDFAEDLNEIIRKEKIKKIILIGHSLGGLISLVFYKSYKPKIKKLILIDTTYKNPIPNWYRYFISPLDYLITQIVFHTPLIKRLPKYYDFYKLRSNSEFLIVIKTIFYRRNLVQLNCIKNLRNFNATEIIKKINVPTLIIGSKQDELFPIKVPEEMHKYIKTSKLEILEGNHSITLKKSSLISKEIQKFIR